jgi:O-antigen/teichoic acid export membrane protein
MNFIRTLLNKSDFLKNSLILITGTTIAQVIPVALSPVISRLFDSDDFAVFGLFFSIAGVISGIAAGTYEFAIVLPKKDVDAKNLIALSVIITVLTFLISFVLFAIFNRQIGELLNNTNLSLWLLLVPVSVLFITFNSIVGFWFNRKKDYGTISLNKIIRNGTIAFGNILLGIVKLFKGGLIIGQIFGDFVATLVLINRFFRNNKLSSDVTKTGLRTVALEFRKFPIFTLPNTLLNNLSFQLPVLLISIWFNPALTGSYFFSSRILAIPIALIGASVSQVFYQKFTEIINDHIHDAKRFLIKVWVILFAIGIVPFGVLFLFGKELFGFIFGPEWITAGEISALLAPMILFMFISSPTSSTYLVLGKQNINVFFGVASFIYRPLAIYIGYLSNDLFLGLKLLVLFEIIEVILYNIVIFRYL